MDKLKDKVAIITGGNSGIGESTAHLFANEGAKVVILARREKEGFQVQKSIQQNGGTCLFIKCDVTNLNDINKQLKLLSVILKKLIYFLIMQVWPHQIIFQMKIMMIGIQ